MRARKPFLELLFQGGSPAGPSKDEKLQKAYLQDHPQAATPYLAVASPLCRIPEGTKDLCQIIGPRRIDQSMNKIVRRRPVADFLNFADSRARQALR